MLRFRLHLHFAGDHSLGPGKVQLLEAVREHGSISAAARSMGMAYRHAWTLIHDVDAIFGCDVIAASTGGSAGGGAELTPFGEEVVRRFRAMERRALRAFTSELRALEAAAARPALTPYARRRSARATAR